MSRLETLLRNAQPVASHFGLSRSTISMFFLIERALESLLRS